MSAPVQYQQGKVDFLGFSFAVDQRALIPRFETEFLVQKTIDWCHARDISRRWHIVEIGTGSGVIAICLAKSLSGADITSIDISSAALGLARENAIRHHIEEGIHFVEGDLLSNFKGPADIIIANLPYLPTGRIPSLDASVRDFEPHNALDGGSDGLDLYRRLWNQIATLPQRPSLCLFEFDDGQEKIVRQELKKRLPDAQVTILKDTSDLFRYIILEFNN